MIDLEQTVVKKWGKRNKNRYEQLGYVFTKYGDNFNVKIKDLPLDANDTVIVHCDYCGEEKTTKYKRYNDIINQHGEYLCQHCLQKRSLIERQNKFYKEIEKFCNEHNYVLLTDKEEITTNRSPISYICPKHGKQTTTVTSILNGHICYDCAREIAARKHWDYSIKERVEKYYNMALEKCKELGYWLLSKEDEIDGYRTFVKYECPIHGEHKMRFGNLINGRHCPECSRPKSMKIKDTNSNGRVPKNKLTIDAVISRVEQCGGNVINPEDYINQYEKNLVILCPRCGKPFTTSLVLFTQHGGQVCEECYRKESVGERRIRKYLEKNEYIFSSEYWFSDCRDINPLPFDFYIPNLNILIEFDGKQHFYDGKKYFSKNYDYETVHRHDEIKNNYCKDNNIKLIRIPYWNIDKIDEILDKELYYLHEDIV